MPTRPFFENFGTVLWFAVFGTLWNSIGIGISLFAICQIEAFGVQDINLQENLLFASIISAVEPVAVLTVFEDISIHEQLYIVVFGECLFNDAVTVVSDVCAWIVDVENQVIKISKGGFHRNAIEEPFWNSFPL